MSGLDLLGLFNLAIGQTCEQVRALVKNKLQTINADLKGAVVVAGVNKNRGGYTRKWNGAVLTGSKNRVSGNGEIMLEAFDPNAKISKKHKNKNRMLNLATFTGIIRKPDGSTIKFDNYVPDPA